MVATGPVLTQVPLRDQHYCGSLNADRFSTSVFAMQQLKFHGRPLISQSSEGDTAYLLGRSFNLQLKMSNRNRPAAGLSFPKALG
jgi:hypothetical protein